MRETEANKNAWGKLSHEHYRHFKEMLLQGTHKLNPYIVKELGDISGRRLVHLQCNTGADTLLLAGMGAEVTGVDIVPDNVRYARRLAEDVGVPARFIESDIMTLADTHSEQYDVVFVSEGALVWLPDLERWASTVRGLLAPGGWLYVFDAHPFLMTLDEGRLRDAVFEIKYPYFSRAPERCDTIGGYACETKDGVETYEWNYTVSGLVNALIGAGLRIGFFNEYPELFYDLGGMEKVGTGLYGYGYNTGRLPMSFSLRADAPG